MEWINFEASLENYPIWNDYSNPEQEFGVKRVSTDGPTVKRSIGDLEKTGLRNLAAHTCPYKMTPKMLLREKILKL